MTYKIHHGDCVEVMRSMPENSIDAICTDPPYGIGFMGKAWDGKDIQARTDKRRQYESRDPTASSELGGHNSAAAAAGRYDLSPYGMRAFQEWTADWAREAFRVMKPGAHAVVFASPRTYHRMVCGLEEAGFEIRDQIMWVFGSGFPKSRNLDGEWKGWGTALKPAHEPICLARKPFSGTVTDAVERFGTGALNIAGCRVAINGGIVSPAGKGAIPCRHSTEKARDGSTIPNRDPSLGRWPANLIHDGSDEVVALFPESVGAGGSIPNVKITGYGDGIGTGKSEYFGGPRAQFKSGTGSAARFFYCAKASRFDRNDGLDGFEKKALNWSSGTQTPGSFQSPGTDRTSENHHPTVKPTDLMRYLCRLVTPPSGTVLDPFGGSGSTSKAAILEGFSTILIEQEAEYIPIIEQRCHQALQAYQESTRQQTFDLQHGRTQQMGMVLEVAA